MKDRRRIMMNYMLVRDVWYCQFLDADAKTSLPKKLTFQDDTKVIQMARRGGADTKL